MPRLGLMMAITATAVFGVSVQLCQPEVNLDFSLLSVASAKTTALGLPPSAATLESHPAADFADVMETFSVTSAGDSELPSLDSLDLSLPKETFELGQWDTASSNSPNFFKPQNDLSRLDLSGRLLWDESEAALAKPLEETLLGAEVEFKIRL